MHPETQSHKDPRRQLCSLSSAGSKHLDYHVDFVQFSLGAHNFREFGEGQREETAGDEEDPGSLIRGKIKGAKYR